MEKKKVRRVQIIALIILLMLLLVGCKSKGESLIEDGNYSEALKVLEKEKNPDQALIDECKYQLGKTAYKDKKYEDAYNYLQDNENKNAKEYLKKVEPLYLSSKDTKEVIKEYNTMMDDIAKENEGKSFGDDFKNGSDYFWEDADNLKFLSKSIDNGNNPSSREDLYKEVFSDKPKDLKEAKKWMKNLKQYVVWDKNEYQLYYLTKLFIDSEYTDNNMKNDIGIMKVRDMHNFLNDYHISPKTLAHLIGLFRDYGAEITSNNESLTIAWEKETRGYHYCYNSRDTSKNAEKMADYIEKSLNDWVIFEKSSGDYNYYKLNIDNKYHLDFEYLDITFFYLDENGKYISEYNKSKEMVNGDTISFTLKVPKNAENYNFYIIFNEFD